MYNGFNKVRCLEKIVMDNEIGKGLGITNGWNWNGVRMAALKSIAGYGGDEAIKSLKGIIGNLCVNEELKSYASKLLEALVSHRRNKKQR